MCNCTKESGGLTYGSARFGTLGWLALLVLLFAGIMALLFFICELLSRTHKLKKPKPKGTISRGSGSNQLKGYHEETSGSVEIPTVSKRIENLQQEFNEASSSPVSITAAKSPAYFNGPQPIILPQQNTTASNYWVSAEGYSQGKFKESTSLPLEMLPSNTGLSLSNEMKQRSDMKDADIVKSLVVSQHSETLKLPIKEKARQQKSENTLGMLSNHAPVTISSNYTPPVAARQDYSNYGSPPRQLRDEGSTRKKAITIPEENNTVQTLTTMNQMNKKEIEISNQSETTKSVRNSELRHEAEMAEKNFSFKSDATSHSHRRLTEENKEMFVNMPKIEVDKGMDSIMSSREAGSLDSTLKAQPAWKSLVPDENFATGRQSFAGSKLAGQDSFEERHITRTNYSKSTQRKLEANIARSSLSDESLVGKNILGNDSATLAYIIMERLFRGQHESDLLFRQVQSLENKINLMVSELSKLNATPQKAPASEIPTVFQVRPSPILKVNDSEPSEHSGKFKTSGVIDTKPKENSTHQRNNENSHPKMITTTTEIISVEAVPKGVLQDTQPRSRPPPLIYNNTETTSLRDTVEDFKSLSMKSNHTLQKTSTLDMETKVAIPREANVKDTQAVLRREIQSCNQESSQQDLMKSSSKHVESELNDTMTQLRADCLKSLQENQDKEKYFFAKRESILQKDVEALISSIETQGNNLGDLKWKLSNLERSVETLTHEKTLLENSTREVRIGWEADRKSFKDEKIRLEDFLMKMRVEKEELLNACKHLIEVKAGLNAELHRLQSSGRRRGGSTLPKVSFLNDLQITLKRSPSSAEESVFSSNSHPEASA